MNKKPSDKLSDEPSDRTVESTSAVAGHRQECAIVYFTQVVGYTLATMQKLHLLGKAAKQEIDLLIHNAKGTLLRTQSQIVTWAKTPVRYSWRLAAIHVVFIDLALVGIWIIPIAGLAVAFLGLVAIIMSVRAEEKWSKTEKIMWLFLATVLMVVEVRAINKDHNDHEDAQRNADVLQLEEFDRIARRIDKSIDVSKGNYSDTMTQLMETLKTTKRVADMTKRNLDNINGTGSFPCVFPQSHGATDLAIPLDVHNVGSGNTLTGVEIQILTEEQSLKPLIYMIKPQINVGTVTTIWPKPLPEAIVPQLNSEGIAQYEINIWTQSGYYWETMQFRRGKYALPWAYKFWTTERVLYSKKQASIPAGSWGGKLIDKCTQFDWSDDLGDGKPVGKNP